MTKIMGDGFAVKRLCKLKGSIKWVYHSDYKSCQICRAYHVETGKPSALYRACPNATADMQFQHWVVGESLGMVKANVTRYRDLGEGAFARTTEAALMKGNYANWMVDE